METNHMTALEQYRLAVYHTFVRRADAAMDLLDVLSGNSGVRSVVTLSLEAGFRRMYSSIYAVTDQCFGTQDTEARRLREQELLGIIGPYLLHPIQRKFWLFGLDATSVPRVFADTLADRSFVHYPNPVGGNKPITIGRQYSCLAYLPEKAPAEPAWVVPVVLRRITTQETDLQVGLAQIDLLLSDASLALHDELCVNVGDSRYSATEFLSQAAQHANLINIARLRGTRVLYHSAPAPATDSPARGHPTWYGMRFDLREPTTWGQPDATVQDAYRSRHGHNYTVEIQAWYDLLMRDKNGFVMHTQPFTLVRIRLLTADGQAVFKRDLWLVVVGERRHDLALLEVQQAYFQRYDLEHFFRFGKQRLLLASFQTPDDEHEVTWVQIVQLAYVQLYLTRTLAGSSPRPWERYLPARPSETATPTMTQRAFGSIIRQIGTPAVAPKPRGKAPGRAEGMCPAPRPSQPVIKKTAKQAKAA
jgi:hypothetical protein